MKNSKNRKSIPKSKENLKLNQHSTLRTVHMCVRIIVHTVVYNTAQNSSDNFCLSSSRQSLLRCRLLEGSEVGIDNACVSKRYNVTRNRTTSRTFLFIIIFIIIIIIIFIIYFKICLKEMWRRPGKKSRRRLIRYQTRPWRRSRSYLRWHVKAPFDYILYR